MSLMLWMITLPTHIHKSTCEVLAYKHFDYKIIYIEHFFGCLKITWIWQEAIPQKISISYRASKSLSQYRQMKNGEKMKNKYGFQMTFHLHGYQKKEGRKTIKHTLKTSSYISFDIHGYHMQTTFTVQKVLAECISLSQQHAELDLAPWVIIWSNWWLHLQLPLIK